MLFTDFTTEQRKDIWDHWQASHCVSIKRIERLKYCCDKLTIKYPNISRMSFYKFLDREIQ